MTQPYSFAVEPTPVAVSVVPAAPQRRVTVGLRLLFAIPAMVFAWVLGVAAGVVVVVAWFAALFTGQVPEGIHRFLHGVVGLTARLHGYLLLLTDAYPPFRLDAPDYPITVSVVRPNHNRLAVLFRAVLALPVALLTYFLNFGAALLAPIAWLVTLVRGRLPDVWFDAYAAVVRYQARYNAYAFLLTTAYPADLFGDPPAYRPVVVPAVPAAPPPAPPASMASMSTSSTPSTLVPGAPLPPPRPAADWAPPSPATMAPPESIEPAPERVTVGKGGKRLLVAFIVLGVIGAVGIAAAGADTGRADAIDQINREYRKLDKSARTFQSETTACGVDRDFPCLQRADLKLAGAFDAFADAFETVTVPAGARAAAATVLADARRVAGLLTDLGRAPTLTAYQALVPDLQVQLTKFDDDYRTFARTI